MQWSSASIVRAFAERLRSSGIRVILDQFLINAKAGGPGEDWARWSTDQANQTERVIIIGSESWFLGYLDLCPDDASAW